MMEYMGSVVFRLIREGCHSFNEEPKSLNSSIQVFYGPLLDQVRN